METSFTFFDCSLLDTGKICKKNEHCFVWWQPCHKIEHGFNFYPFWWKCLQFEHFVPFHLILYLFFFFLLIWEVSEQSSYYALLKQIPLQTNWLHATLNTLYSFDLSAKDVICDLSSLDRVLYSVQLPFTPSCFCPRNVKVTYCYLQALKPT